MSSFRPADVSRIHEFDLEQGQATGAHFQPRTDWREVKVEWLVPAERQD